MDCFHPEIINISFLFSKTHLSIETKWCQYVGGCGFGIDKADVLDVFGSVLSICVGVVADAYTDFYWDVCIIRCIGCSDRWIYLDS